MLHVIHSNGDAGDHHLRAMYEARKRVFVDLLKWDVPVLADRYELDQFDNEHARYLIVADLDGGHLASTRLLSTSGEHLLGGVFSDLCDGPVPQGPQIFEISRFCLDRTLHASDRREARDILIRALVDHALALGISTYTGVAEMGWFQQILAFGWDCRPLGRPRLQACRTLIALRIDITPETPQLLARGGIVARTPAAPKEVCHVA